DVVSVQPLKPAPTKSEWKPKHPAPDQANQTRRCSAGRQPASHAGEIGCGVYLAPAKTVPKNRAIKRGDGAQPTARLGSRVTHERVVLECPAERSSTGFEILGRDADYFLWMQGSFLSSGRGIHPS